MIGAVFVGWSSGNLTNYALKEEKTATLLAAHGVREWSAGEMAADFEAQQQLRPDVNRVMLHVALAWHEEEKDKLSNELIVELATAYMAEMGIDSANTQWALVRHFDQDHPHCHLLINRVDNDGNVLTDSNDFERSIQACRVLEKRYDLLNAADIGLDQRLKQAQEGALSSYEAAQVHVQDALRRHLPAATTVEGLSTALAGEGITMHGKFREQKLYSVVFECEGHFVKGSALDRQLSGSKLQERLETQQQQALAAARAAASPQDETNHSQTSRPQALPAALPVALDPVAPLPAPAEPATPRKVVAVADTTPDHVQSAPQQAAVVPVSTPEAALPSPLPAASEPSAAELPTEAQRQATIFREAAAGEWESVSQAQHLVYELLTNALHTTETSTRQLLLGIEAQGYKLNRDFTLIRHQESGLEVTLADVQRGGAQAPAFIEQVRAVTQDNRAAEQERARQATEKLMTSFLGDKPHFIGLEELKIQLVPYGLDANRSAVGQAGIVLLTHMASGHRFPLTDLSVNGQPLSAQLEAARLANWQNPARQVQIHCHDEKQVARISSALSELGVGLQPAPGGEPKLLVGYRLDSPHIEEIDALLQAVKQLTGTKVEESAAATNQRSERALEHYSSQQPDIDKSREQTM